ncbi:MAG: starch-binding protein, partial [Erysipelotrichales bacterium]|nr:starch-binding protein [Erysipelotrichales bacterium]
MKSSIKKLMFTFAFAFGALTMVSCGEHKHNLAKDWSKDATKHWHDCDGCDELVDKAAHAWGNWIVDEEATDTTKGSQHRVCSVCGYVGTEAIPMLAPEFGVATELTAVYAQVPADWEDDVNIYYWAGNEGNSIADGYGVGWPGTPMTLVNEEEHIWGFKVPA